MGRALSFFIIMTAIANLGACPKARMEITAGSTPEMARALVALRGAYAAFNRGDIDSAIEPFDAQIEWSEPAEFPGEGTCHGRDAVKRYLTQSRAAWAEGSSEPERFITSGNRIVVFVRARFRLTGRNEWQDVSLADVYTFRNGRAIQMRAFADRQDALRWVGIDAQQDPGK